MSISDQVREFYANIDNESLLVRGTVTTPGANTIIAQVTPGPAGLYEITAMGRYGAVADVIDNMELNRGGTLLGPLPVQPAVNGTPVFVTFTSRLAANAVISVKSSLAGGAGAVYTAFILLKKVSD